MFHRNRSPLMLTVLMAAIMVSPAATAELPEVMDNPSAIRILLSSELETTLSSQMNGTLGELNASLGKTVKKGELIASLNCLEAQARSKVASAELAMARQNLNAKKSLRKLDAVGDLEVAIASTEVQKAQGAESMAKAQSGYCSVVAPFSGRIAKVYVKSYQTVSAGTPLFDLVSDGALKVRLNVPSSLLPSLKEGMALTVDVHETGKRYPAHISAINARVDAVAQTIELEARLDQEYPDLIAGMSGTARIPKRDE